MQPLSRRTRHTYLAGFILIFVAIMPFVLFYASGYRYRKGLGIVQTGGIYVAVPYSGAQLTLDGEGVGTASILNRGFFIDNLTPGSYVVKVEKPSYRPWRRTLVVEEKIVTDARAFLVPEDLPALRIVTSGTPTSTRVIVSRSTYDRYLAAFAKNASTTDSGAVSERGNEGLFVRGGDVSVRWLSEDELAPSVFCGRPSHCMDEIMIERSSARATYAAFFGGGVVYATREKGVFLAEADARPTTLLVPVYPKSGATFRIVDGSLIIKDGTNLYLISGL